MNPRVSSLLTFVGLTVGAAALSAFGFVAFLAPSWPRTAWGWLISAALGLPLVVAIQVIIALCFGVGPPRFHFVRRNLPSGTHVFRYHAGSRGAQAVLLAVRILVAAALCGLLIWLVYAVLLRIGVVRAQFR
jgi:hypothetical protein